MEIPFLLLALSGCESNPGDRVMVLYVVPHSCTLCSLHSCRKEVNDADLNSNLTGSNSIRVFVCTPVSPAALLEDLQASIQQQDRGLFHIVAKELSTCGGITFKSILAQHTTVVILSSYAPSLTWALRFSLCPQIRREGLCQGRH